MAWGLCRGFPQTEISSTELDDLIDYLRVLRNHTGKR
jgi:hypothetical protein